MKYLLLTIALLFFATGLSAQVQFGIFSSPTHSNRLEIRLKSAQTVTDLSFSSAVFTVRFLNTYNVTLSVVGGPTTNPYAFTFVSPAGDDGTYKYYRFYFVNFFIVNWQAGQEYLATTLQHNNTGMGVGTFELISGVPWTNANNGNFFVELDGLFVQNGFYQSNASISLPVELLHFNARAHTDGTSILDWESSSERSLAYYEVEHSTDGQFFLPVDKVHAKGGEDLVAQYSSIHKTPQAGINYYRLRMVDANGDFEYSPLRNVMIEKEDADFSVLPTSTNGPFSLTSRRLEKYPEGLKYQLTDNSGRLIRTDKITSERMDFNLSEEASGTYYLSVLSDRERIAHFPVVLTK